MAEQGSLTFSRRAGQAVFIDGRRIEVRVETVRGDRCYINFKVPKAISVHREEVLEAIEAEKHKPQYRPCACGGVMYLWDPKLVYRDSPDPVCWRCVTCAAKADTQPQAPGAGDAKAVR